MRKVIDMERSKRTRKVPYKLRDFHIELVDFRHQIRANPEQEKVSASVSSSSPAMRQIRNELLFNFKEKSAKQGEIHDTSPLDRSGEDIVTEGESTDHSADYEPKIEEIKPVKRKFASASSSNSRASQILPDNWMSLEVSDLATVLTETCGVDPVIFKEHLIPNGKKVKREEQKSIVLPSNWRDKLRDELIEEICTENKLPDREVVATELRECVKEPSSQTNTLVKLPANWRSMTKEELEGHGISV